MIQESTSATSSNQQTVDRPTRGADRNRALVEQNDPASDDIHLPTLADGITLLDVEGSRGVPILQSLVLDQLLLHDGPAFWVDANGHATTTSLARIAPSQRLLDRIHVARGFTAYQHYGAIADLPPAVNQYIQQTSIDDDTGSRQPFRGEDQTPPHTPALIVAPAVDVQYRPDDRLSETQAATLQARTLARLGTYAEGYDVPVLVTRSNLDEFTAPVETAADHQLTCERTHMGPRFIGDEFETLVYPLDGGVYYQTTFAYWRQVLGARAEQVGLERTTSPSPTDNTAAVGTGVTVGETSKTLTANPLLDAWTTTASAGGR